MAQSNQQIQIQTQTMIQQCISHFYSPSTIQNYYTCNLCEKNYKGAQKSNLVSHLKNAHKQEFESKFGCPGKKRQDLMITRLEIIQGFVEMVTVNMRPFLCLKDSGLHRSHRRQLEELSLAGLSISVSTKPNTEIRQYLKQTAITIRKQISDEVTGILFSVMIDIVTLYQRSILGISIRFIKDGQVIERSIGMIELTERHRGTFISDEILKCFDTYNINPLQIISMTTDNAKNMISAIKSFDKSLLPKNLESVFDDVVNSAETLESNEESEDNYTIEEYEEVDESVIHVALTSEELRQLDEELENEQALENVIDDTAEYERLLTELVGGLQYRTQQVFNIRCGAHTLQLAVREAFGNTNCVTLIKACRSVAKSLRRQEYICLAKKKEIPMIFPRLSCSTRWDSEYKMLDDVLRCEDAIKYFAKKNYKFRYVLQNIGTINEIVKVSKIPYDTTQKLQKRDFCLSDFYGSWIQMKLKLESLKNNTQNVTDLAAQLKTALVKREPSLLSPAMLCAIYLDGRFPNELTDSQIALVKGTLVQLWDRFKLVTTVKDITTTTTEVINTSDDILEEYLKSKDGASDASACEEIASTRIILEPNLRLTGNELIMELSRFETVEKRAPAKAPCLELWENRKKKFPELYILASVINGIPPTQASVERCFSALSYIINTRRCSLSHESLEDILVVKLNENMVESIFQNDLQQLKESFDMKLIPEPEGEPEVL